ncbi:SagB family peptide dehydrogenase [Streptomyces sp. KLOTTS4A1]|uniref:SagB family peptide dehydrogenase n=1 Tax=Streptomyces sp. KLOTTS4A1 TaxID=3390996 RepID=UPI0039F50617
MSTPPAAPPPQPAPEVVELWSLREDTLVELPDGDEDSLVLATRWGEVRLPPRLHPALERMSYGPVVLRNLVTTDITEAARRERDLLDSTLETLENVMVRSLSVDGSRPLLSVVPIARDARFRPLVPRADTLLRLSRYAMVSGDTEELCVESPLRKQRVVLHRFEAAALVCSLAHPATVEELAGRMGLPLGVVRAVVGYLEGAGVLVRGAVAPGAAQPSFEEDHDPSLASWSPVELMMHARSRTGRDDGPVGATGVPRDKPVAAGAAAPVVREPIALPRPELDALLDKDPPLTAALEARSSVRAYGARPLTLAQLAELLFRAARVRTMASAGSVAGAAKGAAHGSQEAGGPGDAASSRPYPSVGRSYALELYLLVSSCEGLAPGAYHYDPVAHALRPVDADPELAAELVVEAREVGGLVADPPVLIVMTARFQQVMARFSGLAYSGLLKDVGVLQQTLYLVCTAMGLAPCALAVGDSDLSARALGLDWSKESSIGEFVLGPLPQGPPGFTPAAEHETPVNGPDWQERCRRVLGLWTAHASQTSDVRSTDR